MARGRVVRGPYALVLVTLASSLYARGYSLEALLAYVAGLALALGAAQYALVGRFTNSVLEGRTR